MSGPPPPPGGIGGGGGVGGRAAIIGPTSQLLARVRTQGYAGYALAWSPFFPGRLATAGAANYGLVGNGRVHLMSANNQQPGLNIEKFFDTQDGLYSVAWSEIHENQLATASGDGSIKMWDVTLNDHPIRNYTEHSREVFSLNWNNIRKELFASGSWDGSVKIWHPERQSSLLTLTSHTGCVYGVSWSPHSPDLLASACGDGNLRLFDLRTHSAQLSGSGPGGMVPHQLANQPRPVVTIPVGGEVLSLDWNKYRPMTIATGSTDRTIKVWDLRNAIQVPQNPNQVIGQGGQMTTALLGHEYAVRSVAWSPHSPSILASASYDMTARVWDSDAAIHGAVGSAAMGGNGSLRKIHDGHTEFVAAVAWSLFEPDRIASCAWDAETHLW